MTKIKNIFLLLNIIFPIFLIAQKQENILEAEFAYFSKAKLDKTNSHITEEIFLLQILKDKAFFFSENMAKNDSILKSDAYKAFAAAPKGGSIIIKPSSRLSSKYSYIIIQSNEGNEYLESIGFSSTPFAYQEPIIKNWKLLEETQNINSFHCKKAILNYKGRNWIAWYDDTIPLPYGPYKFTGLPGLIIKIESEDGDFSFELVKSTPKNKLNGKGLSLRDTRYKTPKTATFAEMRKIKKNTIERLVAEASSMGIDTSAENTRNLLQRQKQKLQDFENENLIEKTE